MMGNEITTPRPRGRNGGRPRLIADPVIVATVQRMHAEGATISGLCQVFNVSRSTLYRLLLSGWSRDGGSLDESVD
jgi:DNA invertase Pin-like site-specific DNA recombinase